MTTEPKRLDNAPLAALALEIDAVPPQVDGLDMASHKQTALFHLDMAMQSIASLRKLSRPDV